MIIHFEKNGEQFEGEISEEIYDDKIFPIFIDHLIPVEQKKFYTKEQVLERPIKKLTKPQNRIWGWEMSFGLVTFGIMIGLIVSGVL